MGRFFACLGICRHRKSKNSSNPITSGLQKHEALQFPEPLKQEKIGNPISTIPGSREKLEDDLSCRGIKKVTFGLNVKSEEENFLKKSASDLMESGEEKVGEKREETLKESGSHSDSFTPIAVMSSPSNHRYQNCRNSDSELEDLELRVKELDNNDIDEKEYEGEAAIKEESSESLFSLSIESRKQVYGAARDEKEINSPVSIESRKQVHGAATDEKEMSSPLSIESRKLVCGAATDEKVMDSPMPKPGEWKGNRAERRQYVDSVLNPIESPSQWKKMKARAAPAVIHHSKENIKQDANIVSVSMEPSLKPLSDPRKLNAEDHPKPVDEWIAADASLSSWLVGLETTPNSKTSTVSVGNSPSAGTKSPRRHEDATILSALTMEEIKQVSATSSPRRSPSRSPSLDQEPPIIGTVGSYWSHTGQSHDHAQAQALVVKEIERKRNFNRGKESEAEFYTY